MNNFTNDVVVVLKIASCIASDNYKLLESNLSKLSKLSKLNKLKIKKSDKIVEKIYETILQTYLFCGFPATLESLKIFKKYFPEFYKSNSQYDVARFRKTGEANCKLIYKKNYKKLIESINSLSPDLKNWMLIEGYGKVFARQGLSLLEREFVNVAILCSRYYENQLHSHIKGCINLGATKEDIGKLLIEIKDTAGSKNVNKGFKLLSQILK